MLLRCGARVQGFGTWHQDLGQGSKPNSLTSKIWSQAPRILGRWDEGSREKERIERIKGQGSKFWGWAPRNLAQLDEGSKFFALLGKDFQEICKICLASLI